MIIIYYYKGEENKSKIGQERNSMQQADYQCHRPTPWMQEVCPCTKALLLSGIRAWIKQGRRKRNKRGRKTGKTEARRLKERKAAQQSISEEQKQGLPMHS